MFTDIVEVGNSLLQVHAIDCLGRLAGVFEVDAEIGAAGLGRLGRVDGRCRIADHDGRRGGDVVAVGNVGGLKPI